MQCRVCEFHLLTRSWGIMTRRKDFRTKVLDAISKVRETGDSTELQRLANQADSRNKVLQITKSMREMYLESLKKRTDGLLARMKDDRQAPGIWKTLLDELFVRAFSANVACFGRFADRRVADLDSAFVRLIDKYGDQDMSCEKNMEDSIEFYRRLYEIYLKTLQCQVFMIDAIDTIVKSGRRRRSIFKRIKDFERGRYAALLPDVTDEIMRDAVSHESVHREPGGMVVFRSDRGVRRLAPDTVDKRSFSMLARVLIFSESLNLALCYSMRTMETAVIERERERRTAARYKGKRRR